MNRKGILGAAVVEFAIVLPLFLLVFFAIIAFSVALYDKAVITNAAREGARAGIVLRTTKYTATEIANVVTAYCGSYLITFGAANSCTANVTGAQGVFGSPLTVTVSYQYSDVSSRWFPASTLTATAVMKNE